MGLWDRSRGRHDFGNFRKENQGEKIKLAEFGRVQFQIAEYRNHWSRRWCLLILTRARAGAFALATVVNSRRHIRTGKLRGCRRTRLDLGELDHQSQKQADNGLQNAHVGKSNASGDYSNLLFRKG